MKTFLSLARALCIALVLFVPLLSPQASAQISTNVVLSEVYGGGGNSGSIYTNDYVELYNPTGAPINLSGWSIQYASAAGSFLGMTPLTGSIAAHSFYLVQEALGAGGTTPLPTPDDIGTIAMSATNGKIALVNTTTLIPSVPDASIQDLIGYGTANAFEGAVLGALSNTTCAERKAQTSSTIASMGSGGADEFNGNGWDTQNNSADFVIQTTQNPQNSASSTETPPVISNIPPIISSVTRLTWVPATGTTDTVTASIQDLDGTITGAKLHVRLNNTTYDSSITMAFVSGTTYRGVIPSTKHTTNGHVIDYFVSATDDSSAYSQSTLSGYFVGDAPISSVKAQTLSTIAGFGLRVNGFLNVKTNSLTNGQGFVQDGGGGLQIFSLSPAMPTLDAGRNAKIEGTITNFNNAYELQGPNFSFVDTTGTSVLTPVTITLPIASNLATNANEGRLVKFLALSTDSTGTFAAAKSYIYKNGTLDTIEIRVNSASGGNNLVGRTIPVTAVDAMGVLSFNGNHLRLLPRKATDMGFDPGDGTGTATIAPISRFPSQTALKETLTVTGDGTNTLKGTSVSIPITWTWDGVSYATSGAGFVGASFAVTGTGLSGNPYVITASAATITNVNTGTIVISNLTSPGTIGSTTFTVQTKGSTGTAALASIAVSPVVGINGGFEAILTGNWNQTATWSGGVVPGAADDVTMGTLGVTVTVTANAQAHHLTMTGSGSASNSGPLLQFSASGALTLTVNGDLSITGGSGGGSGDRGGRAKLNSNTNSSAILIVKGDITTNSSNSDANGHAGLNMNEGTTKLTGATSDTLKNGAGFRMGNLEIGDGAAAKTWVWAQTATSSTMNIRSLRIRTNSTFWAGSATGTAANTMSIGDGANDTLPHLSGGIIVDAGAALRVQESPGNVVTSNLNLDGGGIVNSGTIDLHSTGASSSHYNLVVGPNGGNASSTQTISGNAGTFTNVTVSATDTLALSQDMNLVAGDSVKLNGTLVESAGNTVHGKISATRTLSTGVADNFGGIGAVINAAGAAPGATTVTRVTEVAQTGGGNNSILRYFDIDPAVNAGLNASFEYHYDNGDLNGQTAATLSLWKSTDAGSTWTPAGGTADAPGKKVSLSGIGSFSRWTAADATHPLGSSGATYHVNNNWNMVSLSLAVADARKTILYPTATSNAFAYAGGYLIKDTLVGGLGYWLKFGAAQDVVITGATVSLDTVDLAEGWNMVGTITNPVPTASITQIPGGIVSSFYFGYNAGYNPEDTLVGGKGYWVKAGVGGGKIVLSTSPLSSKAVPVADPLAGFNTLTVTDKNGNRQVLYFGADGGVVNASRYELPPVPPAGIADVRFASQRYVETVPAANASADYGISMRGLVSPVTITWKVAPSAERSYQLTDGVNGKLVGIKKLAGEGSMTVNAANLNSLILKVTGAGAIPKEFSLSANYPNPFNPSTKFRVAVPQDAYVEVAVYDLLGRKVATLVSDVRTAGYHTIEWNGLTEDRAAAVTGVYFVRMASGSFSQIQKIMLMK